MSGTIRQDPNGTWWFQTTITQNGQRKHIRRRGFPRKKDAAKALTEMRADHGRGDKRAIIAPSTQPLGEYLDAWLAARRVAGRGLKPATASSYAMVCRVYLAPLRSTPLCDLSGEAISRWHVQLRERGGKKGRPLSARTGAYASRVLAMALGDATETGKLARSPFAEIAKSQRPTQHKQSQQLGRVWSGEQARRFLASVRVDRLYPLFAVLLDSGARRGEVLGLMWPDIDLDGLTVKFSRNRVLVDDHVEEGTPKNDQPRTVNIDARTAAALRRWHKAQIAERLAAGAGWADSGYLFTDELGAPLRPDSVSGRFERLISHLDVPAIPLHGLRHTSGTIALRAGTPLKVVADRLGHNASILIDLYQHVMPGDDRDAADKVGGQIYGTGGAPID
jgi:integrase